MARIIVIDDNDAMRDGMAITIKKMGHDVVAAAGGEAGLAAWDKAAADFVITDLKMAPVDGIAVIEGLKERDASAVVMVVTGHGDVEKAVEAMKLGAFDFIQKPFSNDVLRAKVEQALELGNIRQKVERLTEVNRALTEAADDRFGLGEMVGDSPKMAAVFKSIERVAGTDASVHVHGESGTGKELVARALHNLSARKDGPFIKVNCGALTETLLESELFGHEKGAFTGAIKKKLGRFELADGGTLFLDEIGDITPGLQVKLLRVLQEQQFERVGGEATVSVDVRVVSATNKDLKTEVDEGRFREDLYYRLHVVPVSLPPLRERGEDVLRLAEHFVEKIAPRMGRDVSGFSPEAEKALLKYPWPGNVRELENAIEQALVFAEGSRIELADLPDFLSDASRMDLVSLPTGRIPLPEILEDLERQLIVRAYEEAGGVKTETARKLGIKTSALYYKLDKYGIGDRGGDDSPPPDDA